MYQCNHGERIHEIVHNVEQLALVLDAFDKPLADPVVSIGRCVRSIERPAKLPRQKPKLCGDVRTGHDEYAIDAGKGECRNICADRCV